MKLKKLIVATAAVVVASQVSAQSYTGSLSAAIPGGPYAGAQAVGIVANPLLRDALQAAQLDAACVGNDSKTCMPSISTIELGSLLSAGFGNEWGADYGITAFGVGSAASPVVCEISGTAGPISDAARVGARHVGYGCVDSNPDLFLNELSVTFGIGGSLASCMTTIENTFAAGAIGFASADTVDASYRFVKLDGESPDLANFIAGNYAMFGDVHGTLTGATTAQPFGTTGAVALGDNPPMHIDSGSSFVSNECATGQIRNKTNGNLVD